VILLFSFSESLSQRERRIEELTELDIQAIHQLAQNDNVSPFQLLRQCSLLGIITYLLKEGSVLSESVLPDYILFFDGTAQKNRFVISDLLIQNEFIHLDTGNLIAVIIFEDNPNEHYNINVFGTTESKTGNVESRLTNVTQVHTNGSPAKILPLQTRLVSSTPYYVFSIEYYRYTSVPNTISIEVVPTPGTSFHYNNFGAGVSWVWTHQPETAFNYDPVTTATTAYRTNEYQFKGDGMLSFQVFPNRDPQEPSKLPWERRFYSNFFSKFGFQTSMGFTRFGTYFDHWFVGGTFQLYQKLYLYCGTSFVQLPRINEPTYLVNTQQHAPEQYMRGDYSRLFFIGVTVSLFEF